MARTYHNILVRDGIPRILTARRVPHEVRTATDDDEYAGLLDAKLYEATDELIAGASGNRTDIANRIMALRQVLGAVQRFSGITRYELEPLFEGHITRPVTAFELREHVDRVVQATDVETLLRPLADLLIFTHDLELSLLGTGGPKLTDRAMFRRLNAGGDYKNRTVLVWTE